MRWENVRPFVSTIPSPVSPAKQYFEFNTLLANSISFGVRVDEMSMIAMQTVESQGRIQITLNLKHKELNIQFPLNIGNRTRKFRFRLPISLLSQIYKISNDSNSHATLIIPFDHPPLFFRQKSEGEDLGNGRKHTSFSAKERRWNDWNTWFRETDIIDDVTRDNLKGTPLMNHKDTAVIDIGKRS